jgi:hypothetical protein
MGFSYLGDQDTSPGNYWDSFLGPSRSPGSVLIIFLIIIIIVSYGIYRINLIPYPRFT